MKKLLSIVLILPIMLLSCQGEQSDTREDISDEGTHVSQPAGTMTPTPPSDAPDYLE